MYLSRQASFQKTSGAAMTSLVQQRQQTTFRFYPADHLLAIVNTPAQAEAALRQLLDAGFPPAGIATWHGAVGAAMIDPAGVRRTDHSLASGASCKPSLRTEHSSSYTRLRLEPGRFALASTLPRAEPGRAPTRS